MSEAIATPDSYSYLRCVRRYAGPPDSSDIIDLKTFQEAILRPMAKSVFGVLSQEAVATERPATLEEQLAVGYRPLTQLSHAPIADIRGHDSVRAVLFDARAKSTEENDMMLARAEARATASQIMTSGKSHSRAGQSAERRTRPNTLSRDLDDVQEEVIGSRGVLTVVANRIVLIENDDDSYRFALRAIGLAGEVLLQQHELITTSLNKATAFRPIFSRKQSDEISLRDSDPRDLEIMKVAKDTDGDAELFLDRINEQLSAEGRSGMVGFTVHPQRWRSGLFHQ